MWARWVSSLGPIKRDPGSHRGTVVVGGQAISEGEIVVLDGDGVIAVGRDREDDVLKNSLERARLEGEWIPRLAEGASTIDLMGLRPESDGGP